MLFILQQCIVLKSQNPDFPVPDSECREGGQNWSLVGFGGGVLSFKNGTLKCNEHEIKGIQR